MKTVLRVVVWCGLFCGAIWLLIVLAVAGHVQSRMDVEVFIRDVSRELDIPRDKLLVLNEPRHSCPVAVFECLEDHSNVLEKCELIVPPIEDLMRVPESDRNLVRQVFKKEFDRRENWVRNTFKNYEIALNEELVNLYYTKGNSSRGNVNLTAKKYGEEFIVVETAHHVYVLCLIAM